VAIQGTQPRVFMAMLEYIYTGRLPAEETVSSNGTSASGSIEEAAADDPSLPNINPDTVVELLLAADRFLLDDLKQLCEAALEQSLESSNATWMLELSDRYHSHFISFFHHHLHLSFHHRNRYHHLLPLHASHTFAFSHDFVMAWGRRTGRVRRD
jgi:hypothetical protein